MKGTILKCLQEMVESRFGKQEWKQILSESGFAPTQLFTLSADVDEQKTLALFSNTAEVLEIPAEQVMDDFGDYWVNEYASRIYHTLFGRLKSAREFILGMDQVHIMVTSTIENAQPPRFEFEERGPKVLVVTYKSKRGLIDLYIGLARGVGKYFGTPLEIVKLNQRQVQITFP